MPRDTLTGSRIRERRVVLGMKQVDLANRADISASYLNLIEHNRRRIGGKLLVDIAHVLGVEPVSLAEGAETTLLSDLRAAATDGNLAAEDIARVEEFAGRFPGWADLVARNQQRIETLERSVETLTDRMTHDPRLAASLHEMLSMVTAIRSAASILAEPGDIEPEWQRRFNRNIYEDSARLADTSRSLVKYLEDSDADLSETSAPQDEVDSVMQRIGFHVAPLEHPEADAETALDELGAGLSQPARWLLGRVLRRYARDARAIPLADCAGQVRQSGSDPLALAARFGTDLPTAMRRLAHLPSEVLPEPVGLAICDGSGVTTYRKPLPDFPLPRLGAGCSLWLLYRALSRPMAVLSERVEQSSRAGTRYRAIAIAQPRHAPALNEDPLLESHMLVVPETRAQGDMPVRHVGLTCRICPHADCRARREPSILVG